MIPLDSPLLTGNEKKYLNECIDTNWISWQGKFVDNLESEIANYCGTKHGIAIVNGTYSLVIALRALNVGPGDEVIVPTLTMSASTFAISSVGAIPVWVDCLPNSLLMDPLDVYKKISKKTKAIMAVHLYGHSVDMTRLKEVAGNIPIIEDAAESFGAKHQDIVVGGFGDIACHSFHNKIIGSGEGGAITTNSDYLAERVKELRVPAPDNSGSKEFTLNNRMSNLAAAVALAQLEKVDHIISLRQNVAKLYESLFSKMSGVEILQVEPNNFSVYWRYQIFVDNSELLVAKLAESSIESRTIFKPMHRHPYYDNKDRFVNAEHISSRGVDLPSGPCLTEEQIYKVVEAVKQSL